MEGLVKVPFLLTFNVPNLGSRTTKYDVISILVHKYTYTNIYIIKKLG